jgi:four helix bundle protein
MEDRSLKMEDRRSKMKSMMTFEDLDVWKQARTLVNAIYTLTRRESLARDFGLCGQLQRAAVSVMTNVAEGFERAHVPEKLQFYNVARSSAGEVRSLLYVVSDNFPGTATEIETLRGDAVGVGKLVTGLIASTEKRRSHIARRLSAFLALF